MSVWLRLGWTFATQSLRGARADVFDTTRVTTTTLPTDLDLNRHVNNGRYLSLADLGRFDWFYRTRMLQSAAKAGAFPVIGDVTARYVKQVRAFEPLVLETELLGWDAKWVFLQTRLSTKDGALAAMVTIRGMFWSRSGGLKPTELMSLAGYADLTSPILPLWVQKWAASLDELSSSARAARKARAGAEAVEQAA